MFEIRIEIADQIHGRAFWNHSGFDVPVTDPPDARSGFSNGTNSLRKCSEQSFCVRQMESLFSRFSGQSNFSTASLNASILPATEGSPVNFPSMLLCRNGAELQTLTSDGTR